MTLLKPVPGLVINYAYLWAEEQRSGEEDGRKNRPCAIVAARQVIAGREVVTVLPVTHSIPVDPAFAIEIPQAVKAHLGLDHERSWVILTETNDFIWPGPDLRQVPGRKGAFDYGMLPPRLFRLIRDRLLVLHERRAVARVHRGE